MARIENETQARQGEKGKSTLYALIVGLIVAVVAIVGLLTWQSAKTTSDPAAQSQAAARETAGSSTTTATPNGTTPAQPKAQ